jgi:hypothetical protein
VITVARKEWHWIAHNPFDGVGKFKEGKGSVRFLSDEERERLLAERNGEGSAIAHIYGARAIDRVARR